VTPTCELDHILIGCASLEEATRWFEASTGVALQPGGSHPGRGTRNALLPLSGETYLELLAPDPLQAASSVGRAESENLDAPAFCWWALRTRNLPAIKDVLTASGVSCSEPLTGSRETADGESLQWSMLMTGDEALGCQLPFFIDWGDKPQHPGMQPPVGEIAALEFHGPGARRLGEILGHVGLQSDLVHCEDGPAWDQRLDLVIAGQRHSIAGPGKRLPAMS
jgi:hypothetical protein